MARPIVLGNGEMHVGINCHGLVHDFYFPYVGLENHVAGKDIKHHVGVWVEGQLSWLDINADEWEITFSYPHKALIGRVSASNHKLGVILEFDDAVDAHQNTFMRNIHVVNTRESTRDIRLFMHQAFAIGDSRSNTDTVQYLPNSQALLHYRGRRVFVVAGMHENNPFDQHSVGLFGIENHEGTYRDAEDGELSNGNVEHGRVDSTLRFRLQLAPHESGRVHYWIAAGTSLREALHIHRQVKRAGVDGRMEATRGWWQEWLQPGYRVLDRLEEKYRSPFLLSLMVIKSQIDKRGAVIASTDTTMLNYSRDAYGYCWPRDAAYVLWPLIRLGYTEEPLRFFEFARRVMHPSGYLMHKFRADGALGSSWHPYTHNGVVAPPIQEDETALTLFMFSQFYHMHREKYLLDDFYETLIKPMGNFLAEYIDETTHLPRPSYDLWEQYFLTTTYTTAVVYGALLAAAELAEFAQDPDSAVKWRTVADDIYNAAGKHLYNRERKSFYKGLITKKDGSIQKDDTIDTSSVFGSFMFGLFSAESPELKAAMATLLERFKQAPGTYGLPRYEEDEYHRIDRSIPGNWWFICSYWLAQYRVEEGNVEEAKKIIDWIGQYSLSTGILSEQINPSDGRLLSVAPLTWSHAEYLATLLDMITEPSSKK